MQSGQVEQFMRRAIELGRKAAEAGGGGPFGAVVVKGGAVVGEGRNRVLADNDPTAHGEIMAIRDACRRTGSYTLEGCDLYTSGQPCPMCFGAIHWARIERVYYGFGVQDAADAGFDDKLIYDQLALPLEQRAIPVAQVLGAEARAVLTAYVADPDRVSY